MADLLAIAETLEAQAAALRREHARQAQEGQGALALEPLNEWREWKGGDTPPPEAVGKNVVLWRRREPVAGAGAMWGPADAFRWNWDTDEPEGDIMAWRLADEQPADRE
jgi:hypothetical protein